MLTLPIAVILLAAAPQKPISVTWHGQSMFELAFPDGTRIVTDPIPDSLGYSLPADVIADAVTVSHEHPDHTNVGLVGGSPKVLRWHDADATKKTDDPGEAQSWNTIDEKVKGVR